MSAPAIVDSRLRPIGETCLFVKFGDVLSVDANRKACSFVTDVQAAGWNFITDVVPCFLGVGLHYNPVQVPVQSGESPLGALRRMVAALVAAATETGTQNTRVVEIPVCYGGEFGPDLDEVALAAGLRAIDLVSRHCETTGHVFLVGFAPGHPYMGLWGSEFMLPRRSTPRTRVASGSVAVANRQCVIYPFDLPGGWNVIGRTPLTLFDASAKEPCLLAPGDQVRFIPISPEEFAARQPSNHV
ncbi:MAG: 5-oxoprolinase subunit PxpB [Delftia acidovorans]|nr:5-oxoprolinase subunit PxpB [Delftia acidovorans]